MKLRQQRLADQIRDLLATLFQGGQLNDRRLEGVTITHCKLSPDYQVATVYFRTFDDTPPDIAKSGLESARGLLRNRLASVLDLRRVPTLRFFYDETIENAARIEGLLRNIDRDNGS